MLILARRSNESIMIGDDIEVMVVDVNNRTVKVGIEAPKNVVVHRKEIYMAIKNENLQAVHRETQKENVISLAEYLKKHQ